MFLDHIYAALNRERTVCRTIGDIRLETIERGRRIINFKIHYGDRGPNLLDRFSPEVQQQAKSYRWGNWRERALRKEAAKAGPLAIDVVEQVILHDRAVVIEKAIHRKQERQTPQQNVSAAVSRRADPEPKRREPDYAAMRAAGMSASEIYALHRGVEPVQPSMVATRTRSR